MFHSTMSLLPEKNPVSKFLMTSLHVICGLGPPQSKILATPMLGLFGCHETRIVKNGANLSIFKAVFVPILTYGHESWVMIERMRSQVQASEMRFLRRIEGVTLFNEVRSSEIRKCLNIE